MTKKAWAEMGRRHNDFTNLSVLSHIVKFKGLLKGLLNWNIFSC